MPSTVSVPPRSLPVLLAALTAIGPFSIDTYLPSFPDICDGLGVPILAVQQTLSVYLLAFATMILWHGALADAWGRRRVVIGALLVFAFAAFGAASATSIEQLLVWRALQGMSAGAGIVIGRAIVRDVYAGAAAQRIMARVAMMFALAPAVAPIIGGALQSAFGWRSIFLFLGGFATVLLIACIRALPETLPPSRRQPLHPFDLAHAYRQVLTDGPFLAACAAIACNFLGFFIYVLSAPTLILTHLGLSEREFAWLFIPGMGGLLIGSFVSGRLADTHSGLAAVRVGYALMAAAAVLNVGLHGLTPGGFPWSLLPIPLYTTGMSIAMPSLTLLAIDRFPDRRGLASSCQSFVQTSALGLAAALLAPLLWSRLSHLAAGMAALLALGAAATLVYRSRVRRS